MTGWLPLKPYFDEETVEGGQIMTRFSKGLVGVAMLSGLIALFLLSQTVRAEEFEGKGRLARLQRYLNLTDEQTEAARSLFGQFREQARDIVPQMREARKELQTLIQQDPRNQSQIEAAIDRITGLRGDLMKLGVSSRIAFREVLTSEQRQKLDELKEFVRPPRFRHQRAQ